MQQVGLGCVEYPYRIHIHAETSYWTPAAQSISYMNMPKKVIGLNLPIYGLLYEALSQQLTRLSYNSQQSGGWGLMN